MEGEGREGKKITNNSIKFYILPALALSTSTVEGNATFTIAQPAITCSKLTIETLEQGVKYVRS